jgi:putative spermidine/putrescine transport system permease protein
VPLSLWTIVVGHATFCIVVVFNNTLARLRRMSRSMEEASMDLGGAGAQTLPIWIFTNLTRPNQAPVVNVVAVLLVLISVVPIWLAQRLSEGTVRGAGAGAVAAR